MGYKVNQLIVYDGIPNHVMDRHGFKLEEKYVPLYLKPEERGVVAQWDHDRNLIR